MSFEIRSANSSDADDLAAIYLDSFTGALPTVRSPHTAEQTRTWIREILIPGGHTWVATIGNDAVGMLTLHNGRIDQLYLRPDRQGLGIGSALIDFSKEQSPDGLSLWTFQVNTGARRFYARHGFTERARTDGSANDEREPDVLLRWKPS